MNVLMDEDLPGWDAVVEAGRVPGPDPALLDQVRAALPIRRRRPRRTLALGGLAVAATVAATFAVPWLAGPGAADPAAAAVLVRAADAVAADPVAHPGQFWRVRTKGTNVAIDGDHNATVLVERDRTVWRPVGDENTTWSDDISRTVRVVSGHLTPQQLKDGFPDGHDTWKTEGMESAPDWQSPTEAWLAALPRDTQMLRDKLYADTHGHGRSRDGEVMVYVADVLRSGLVPGDLRAALYRVLTTVPGVRITAADVTVLGRPGMAFGRLEEVDGERQEIVIDQRTGEFVGERSISQEGLVTESDVRRTVVDRVPASIMADAKVMRCKADRDGAILCQG